MYPPSVPIKDNSCRSLELVSYRISQEAILLSTFNFDENWWPDSLKRLCSIAWMVIIGFKSGEKAGQVINISHLKPTFAKKAAVYFVVEFLKSHTL